jgi:threonine synthase
MGVFGVFKAAGEMVELGWAEATPRLLCVQQESCAPMVTAWRDGSATIRSRDVVPNPRGIGTAILRGDPTRTYPHVHRIVRASNGTFTAVSEAAIRDARDMVEELEGVSVCFSAAAAVAGLAELARTGYFSPADTFLVNLTGGERPATPTTEQTQWVSRVDRRWNFEDIRRPNSPSGNFGR